MVTCRECESEVNQATEVCPHCGADLTLGAAGEVIVPKKTSVGKTLLRWGILLTVLLGAIWSFLWFVVSPRTGRVTIEAETQAVQVLGSIHAELDSYAAAQGGTFPGNLESLGQPVRVAAQLAQSEGYRIEYMPAPTEADGGVHAYALEARAGNYGYRNFFTDASGVVRATAEDRDANASDPPIR